MERVQGDQRSKKSPAEQKEMAKPHKCKAVPSQNL